MKINRTQKSALKQYNYIFSARGCAVHMGAKFDKMRFTFVTYSEKEKSTA